MNGQKKDPRALRKKKKKRKNQEDKKRRQKNGQEKITKNLTISQLLYNFPLDYTNEQGVPFWSGIDTLLILLTSL